MESLPGVLLAMLAAVSRVHGQEVAVPERFLRPRTFNPHPYTADLRDYSVEFEPELPRHIPLDQHPYALFQRVDTRNNDNSPVRFPVVPQELKKSIKSKATAKYLHEPKNYAFSYAVKDHQSGDDFSHSQAHNGKETQGEYRVKLPDGRVQVVSYTADNEGYKAEVRYDGERTPDHEENEPSARLSPHPYPVPGYISALYNKRAQRIGPTAQTLLVYTPDVGYRAASVPVPVKYKSIPQTVQKISPTISTDGGLGYQHRPTYYTSSPFSEASTVAPAPDVKPLFSEDALQSIAAKYLQDATSGREHRPTEAPPSLRHYAPDRQFQPVPGPVFRTVLSASPPKVVEEEHDNGSAVNYSAELQSTAFPPHAVYASSTPATPLVYSDAYYPVTAPQTPHKHFKYIYLTPSEYESATRNHHH